MNDEQTCCGLVELVRIVNSIDTEAPNSSLNKVSMLNHLQGKGESDGEIRTFFTCSDRKGGDMV
ncbi:hypothetical protein IJH16_00340 [Candidatus Saccharibacteria bacterium]|nr:hypothetical protein [Candidatus Saccharibacteria bacterium]